MTAEALLRWFIVLYLVFSAAVRIGFRSRIGNAKQGVQRFWCSDDPRSGRLSDALARRLAVDEPPNRASVVSAIAALAFAAMCAFALLGPSLAYAFDCLTTVVLMWRSSKKVGASGPRSAALRDRRSTPTVPNALLAVAAMASLSLVAFGSGQVTEAFAVVAVIATVGLGIGCAVSIAAVPAYLPGEDLEAEMIVDRRLRFFRAGSALITAVAPLFVFASFSGYWLSTARFASWLTCATVTVVTVSWFFVACNRLRLNDAERGALLQ